MRYRSTGQAAANPGCRAAIVVASRLLVGFRSCCMKHSSMIWLIPLFALAASAAEAGMSDADAAKLMAKYNCQTCHTVDKKLVGPAFRDVAKKYASDSTASEKLQSKVKNGGSGVWGPIPMPPNDVPAADLSALVQWITALK